MYRVELVKLGENEEIVSTDYNEYGQMTHTVEPDVVEVIKENIADVEAVIIVAGGDIHFYKTPSF